MLSLRYDKGKELSQRLEMLRDGFAGLQTKENDRVQQTQNTHFRKAHKYLTNTVAQKHKEQADEVNNLVTDKINDLAQLHEIEDENLKLELELTKKPRMKYSRRLLELLPVPLALSCRRPYLRRMASPSVRCMVTPRVGTP